MSSFVYSIGQNLVLSPSFESRRSLRAVPERRHIGNFTIQKRANLGVVRLGLGQVPIPDPENAELMIKDLFGTVEGFLYTLADAAVTSSQTLDASSHNSDWLSGITNAMELVLKVS